MPPHATTTQRFLDATVEKCRVDSRLEGVLVAGSAITGTTDRYSDLDLVIVCRENEYSGLMASRRQFAESLGSLLAAFTGEHVGEPRLLICLYESPLLHVDLKFVTKDSLAQRVETPLIAMDRDGAMDTAIRAGVAEWPAQSPEWFEERFWIWMHYGACKIARGELFEAHDLLAFVRAQVLGPMISRNAGKKQRGVRLLEREEPELVAALVRTIPLYESSDCWRAMNAVIDLYRNCRKAYPPKNQNMKAEREVSMFVSECIG